MLGSKLAIFSDCRCKWVQNERKLRSPGGGPAQNYMVLVQLSYPPGIKLVDFDPFPRFNPRGVQAARSAIFGGATQFNGCSYNKSKFITHKSKPSNIYRGSCSSDRQRRDPRPYHLEHSEFKHGWARLVLGSRTGIARESLATEGFCFCAARVQRCPDCNDTHRTRRTHIPSICLPSTPSTSRATWSHSHCSTLCCVTPSITVTNTSRGAT